MTALTDLGDLSYEQVVVVAAMWCVTDTAVLYYRSVLINEGAPLLRMALVAKFRRGIG